MNEEKYLRNICAARTSACTLWKPIIPMPAAPVTEADSWDERGAVPAAEAPFLEDPEGIESRLAAAS
jgi:hypothetical protein